MENSKPERTSLYEDEGYVSLLEVLMKNRKFRHCFFDDPAKALEKIPVNLSKRQRDRLVNLTWANNREKDTSFDEQLLLCCSPD